MCIHPLLCGDMCICTWIRRTCYRHKKLTRLFAPTQLAIFIFLSNVALTLQEHPVAQSKPFEAEVSLSVSANGLKLQYQWMKDGHIITDDDLPNCNGVKCPNLRITCLSPEHDGHYTCVISSGDCSVQSHSAQLKGNFCQLRQVLILITIHHQTFIDLLGREPLKFIEHPQMQCKVYGDEVIFNVAATGAGTLHYQWMKDKGIISGHKLHSYDGADTPTLHITSFSPEHEGTYMCVVKNEHSDILHSFAADLKGEWIYI